MEGGLSMWLGLTMQFWDFFVIMRKWGVLGLGDLVFNNCTVVGWIENSKTLIADFWHAR